MKRGRLELIGEFLEEIQQNPKLPPSRISARIGATYSVMQKIMNSELVKTEKNQRGHGYLILTERGKQVLQYFRNLNQAVGDYLK